MNCAAPVSVLPDADPVVDIRGLWTVFRSAGVKTIIHKDLDLRITRGELVSIVGGSGAARPRCCAKSWAWSCPRGSITVLGRPLTG